MGATSIQSFEGQSGQFKPYSPFNRKPVELRSSVEDSGDE